ncbi:hypothetical protein H0X06_02945 [Candidatus Dependentiae bacterium]|nr:hypothetical protein [Candidatus Dependentiae bacterium]
MKNVILSTSFMISAFLATIMVQVPIAAMETPKLTLTNRSGKPITIDYRKASNKSGIKNLGVEEKTTILQLPSDSINTMLIKVSGDSSIEPVELDPVDTIKLLEFPTSTITVTLNPQRKLEYIITTPGEKEPLGFTMLEGALEEKAKPFDLTHLKSISEEKAQPRATLRQEALENSSFGKIVWEKAPKKEKAPIILITEEGFKPVLRRDFLRRDDVNITKIANRSKKDIAIIPSADVLSIARIGGTTIEEISGGRTFLIGFDWPTPYFDLLSQGKGSVNLKVTHADSKIFIMIGKTIIHELSQEAINQIREKLGNNVMLTVEADGTLSFETDHKATT